MIQFAIKKTPPLKTNYENQPINKVILFTNARDEKNMKEWCAHHLLLGFHNILIFDHLSKNPLSTELKGFDPRVRVVRLNNTYIIKMGLMTKAIHIARSLQADWMLYLDADEFLVLPKYYNVIDFLSSYKKYDSIAINWLMFGTNNIVNEQEGLIIDNYTKSDTTLDKHIKCFVRPQEAISSDNPHYFILKQNSLLVDAAFNRLPHNKPHNTNYIIYYLNANAYIAHYINQSEETYINRKILLPRDDNGTMRGGENTIKMIHQKYNDVDNFQVKNLYSEKIHEFLDKHI